LLDFVKRADGLEDRRLALEVLANDSSWSMRATATLVLRNFLGDDTSRHGLVGSVIDERAQVSSVAMYMLGGGWPAETGIRSTGPEPATLCWRYSAAPIRSGLRETLEVLVATDIDPEFGKQLVRENPEFLLAHAGAEHERTREPALAFLQAVSDEDFGTDIEAWKAWIVGSRTEGGSP
jgi:hypothetical protein